MSYAGYLGDARNALLGIACAFVLGLASYQLIEKSPTPAAPKRRWKFAAVSGLISTVFVAASAVSATQGAVSPLRAVSISDKARFVQDYANRHKTMYETYWLKCDAYSAFGERQLSAIDPSCTEKRGHGGVFLWGDSHAQALSLGLRTLLARDTPFYQVAAAGCKPSLIEDEGRPTVPRLSCNYSNKTALESIQKLRPDVVIIAQKDQHDKTHWSEIATRLKTYGVKHIVLLGPLPQWNPSLPSVIANRHWGQTETHITDPALDQSVMTADRATKRQIDPHAVDFISLIDKLCVANSCLVRLQDDNSLLQFDSGHLSEKGSLYIVKNFVLPELLKQSIR